VWEMAIKIKVEKLLLNQQLEVFIENFQQDYGFFLLDISLKHIYNTQILPYHHRDPFDRLLIAQSISEDIQIISADEMFDEYISNRLWF
jgi:PIN domain nuclease of toxin-antitoxin system